jgi:hypothetical protein
MKGEQGCGMKMMECAAHDHGTTATDDFDVEKVRPGLLKRCDCTHGRNSDCDRTARFSTAVSVGAPHVVVCRQRRLPYVLALSYLIGI